MGKPKLLDLYCGAGGAAMGYYRAGFEVIGVDIEPQPHFPFEFHQGDALTYPLEGFDAYHASPPCQFASILTPTDKKANHENLIPATRQRLLATGKPFVIENVKGAREHLINPIFLCGTMFGLRIYRHRYFETNIVLPLLNTSCNHFKHPVLISGTHKRTDQPRFEYKVAECREASGIDWMTHAELDQAIPPAYTEYIGKYLIKALIPQNTYNVI
jgi:DNA (cytosine-5)-methyltransferase 1